MTDNFPTRAVDLKTIDGTRRATVAKDDHSEGMSYRQRMPRRVVTLYLPLCSSWSCCCFRSIGWR